jgi:hypothetical protein
MLYSEDIFTELSSTLDQLLKIAKTLKEESSLFQKTELDLLEKTQESLTAHFFHTKEHVCSKKRSRQLLLEEKLKEMEKLNPSFYEFLNKEPIKHHSVGLRPRIGRNRKSSKISKLTHSFF